MDKNDLIQRYDSLLAPYAVKNVKTNGREHEEEEHPHKLPFQRDRDRIVHSKAFRRLEHKTQVIVSPKDDHVRDRLTHSLEGAQIARSLCRVLRLNEDLAEAAILAHDLGHPPFGHEGEHALDEILRPLGYSFDHNQHSERIVTKLEKQYPEFPGLNLSKETLGAIRKHNVPWEKGEGVPHEASLEAQIVNLADEIAYYSHDIDDGIRARILNLDEMLQLGICARASETMQERYSAVSRNDRVFRPQFIRFIINLLVTDIIETTQQSIQAHGITNVEDIYQLDKPVARYSDQMDVATQELRSYLFKNFYRSDQVNTHTQQGKELLKELFNRLYESPEHLPPHIQKQIDNPTPKAIVIKDYIAGMTDKFAKRLVNNLRNSLL